MNDCRTVVCYHGHKIHCIWCGDSSSMELCESGEAVCRKCGTVTPEEAVEIIMKRNANRKNTPLMLATDWAGDAYCPNCGEWLTEYHVSDRSIDGTPQNYCQYCGQMLKWDIDWERE